MNQRTRIAIVTPWFGPDLRGGAEQQSWQLAQNLAKSGYDVDVLTTCSSSFMGDWGRSVLRSGVEHIFGLTVRRFPVRRRNRRAFDRVNAILMAVPPAKLRRSVSPLGDADASVYYENNINSTALCDYLRDYGSSYSHVLFLPYLFGPTLNGLPLVAERAYLQPCLHDESYAYLPRVARVAHLAKGLLFNSDGEAALAAKLFGPGILRKSQVVGEGVTSEIDVPIRPSRIGEFSPGDERYVLYLGRQDPAKNVATLVQAFVAYRRRQPTSQLKLVLAGERSASYGDSSRAIFDLGPVDEAAKAMLLANCRVLAQPSVNESFSRVIYEAWMHGRPIVVHRDCTPTENAVTQSGGGFVAHSVASFETILARVDEISDADLCDMGARGRAYARAVSSWPKVIAQYERALGLETAPSIERSRIWQIVPTGSQGLRRYADALTQALRERAMDVIDATPQNAAPPSGTFTVVHAGPTDELTVTDGPRSLIVHDFGTSGAFANGRAEVLRASARSGAAGFASTPLGVERLVEAGFTDAQFLPVCVDPARWDAMPDLPLASALQDGKHNLLYVGAVREMEHLSQLLLTFLHYLTIEREARLTVVAVDEIDEDVYARFVKEVQRLELIDRVLVARDLSDAQLQACYRSADLFLSLDPSEHLGEHFLEALWFDIPILAFSSGIARSLVGESGILLNDKSDLFAVAALAHTLITDETVRFKIIAKGRRTRELFGAENAARRIATLSVCHAMVAPQT